MVITNAGPLMALGRLGLLELLPSLYGRVRLPKLRIIIKCGVILYVLVVAGIGGDAKA